MDVDGGGPAAFVFKTVADPFAGRINLFRVLAGTLSSDSTLVNSRTQGKERVGQLLLLQGKDHEPAHEFGEGDIGAVAKLKETATGDVLLAEDKPVELAPLDFPQPVMSFAITPKAKGDEEKMATALRRLAEEDPTLDLRRDEQTGEQLLGGLSQMHVEVAVDRLKRRFGVEVDLHQPRVPYLETIRKESRAQGRYKKQTGGRGQFGDCHIVLEPLPGHEGYEFVDKIVGGVIPQSFRPAVDKGIQEAMAHGELAGAPVTGRPRPPRRRLLPHRRLVGDGVQDRRLDGVQERLREGRPRAARADHVARGRRSGRQRGRRQRRPQLAPRAPARHGAGRRGHDDDQGRGADGGDPHVLPVAHVPDGRPRATTRSRFLRYEEVPSHIAQKIIEEAKRSGGGEGVTVVRKQRRPAHVRDLPSDAPHGRAGRALHARRRRTGSTSARSAPTTADEHGWVKEGSPTTPIVPGDAPPPALRRARRAARAAKAEPEPRVSEPMLRRLTPEEQAMVEAAELFNESAYRRTIAGIAKSLGDARVSLLPLSGVNPEVVITVAWDISWYQYRVVFESRQPVRLAERGYELEELDPALRALERAPRPRRPGHARHPAALVRPRRLPIETGTMIYCVIPHGAQGRALRKARRALQGQPERRGDRRPARGPRPPQNGSGPPEGEQRTIRDRRRKRPSLGPRTSRRRIRPKPASRPPRQ